MSDDDPDAPGDSGQGDGPARDGDPAATGGDPDDGDDQEATGDPGTDHGPAGDDVDAGTADSPPAGGEASDGSASSDADDAQDGSPESGSPQSGDLDGGPELGRERPGAVERALELLPDSRTGRFVLGFTALALAVRLLLLGQRAAHWDEGRVAYWTLRYAESGFFEYRPIVHGPFLFQVDSILFSVLGASDFVARLPVALVGGLLPATAWLFRDRLRDLEVVVLSALLAANPLLVYYSRFMRNDVLVAAFAFAALGLFVRAYDTRRARYVYGAAASLALAVTAKENAIVYVVCWIGAGALLLDHRLIDAVRSPSAELDGAWIRERLLADVPGGLAVAFFLAVNPVTLGILGVDSTLGLVAFFAVAVFTYLALLRGSNPLHYLGVLPLVIWLVLATDSTALLPTLRWAGVVGIYGMAWLLAGVLVVDEYLFTPPEEVETTVPTGVAADGGLPTGERTRVFGFRIPPLFGAYLLAFAVLVFFYAPRNPDPGAVGLYSAFLDPLQFPEVIERALIGSGEEFYGHWVTGAGDDFGTYLDRLEKIVRTLASGAGVLVAFAVVGFVYDRWSDEGPRDLVALAGYWGFVSVLGYPYGTDIWAPWIAVHAVVPLAVPAAVGLGGLVRWGRDALDRDDVVTASMVAALLLVLAAPVAVTAVDVAYVNSDDNDRLLDDALGNDERPRDLMVQFAQPGNELKGSMATVDRIAASNDGTDVLFYGGIPPHRREPGDADGIYAELYVPNQEVCLDRPPVHLPADPCDVPELNWHSRLPLPWYLEAADATVTSTLPGADLSTMAEVPPVVIARDWNSEDVRSMLPNSYEARTSRWRLGDYRIVVFVDQDAVPDR